MRERFAGAVGALEAFRAVALLVVSVALLVRAPAADVLVTFDHAGASERGAQDLLRVGFARALRAVWGREDERPRRVLEPVLEDGQERRGDRDDVGMSALRVVALV